MEIGGIRLPRNFQTYGRNNHETWKPALTLEEPDDPSRVCHYAKQLVYPPGAGVEYSPEELLARKYMPRLEEQRKQQQQKQQPKPEDEELKKEPAHEQQQLYDSYESGNSFYMTAVNGEIYAQNEDEAEEDEHEEDEEEDDDVEREQLSEQSEEEEESDGEDSEQQDDEQPKQTPSYTNGIGAVDMQFKAQTTFDQNRSIKMKFKKERTLESSTYSAYTIESIYHHHHQQQPPHELPSPAAVVNVPTAPTPPSRTQDWSGGAASVQRQRNGGNHFHPYLLGQTSTPKSALSEGRRARAKAHLNSKFQPELCSNSNSSSSAAAAASNGVESAASGLANRDANPPIAPTIHNATFNDNANFSFSSAGGLDNSNSSLAMAVDRLHFRDASQVSSNVKSLHPHNNNNNNNNNTTTTPASLAEFSTFQENSYFATQHDIEAQERRLSKALETIERHFAKEAIDPFNSELCRAFLAKINFPGDDGDAHASYKVVQTPLPKISNTRTLNVLESVQFNIDKEVGRGSYGSVYKATDAQTGNVVALKYQKPPNTWEIYICDQVSGTKVILR